MNKEIENAIDDVIKSLTLIILSMRTLYKILEKESKKSD